MPAEVKTAPATVDATTLQGALYTFTDDKDRHEAINKAFDYRGDVTITLQNGENVEGYMGNRDTDVPEPFIEMWVKNVDQPQVYPYPQITAIAFTGKDPASGKSWRNWVAKKEHERRAEMERLRQESEEMGHL
ncbi:MAG: hypothetical protein AAGK14_01805 [Verrucomicrobiota bacterium]